MAPQDSVPNLPAWADAGGAERELYDCRAPFGARGRCRRGHSASVESASGGTRALTMRRMPSRQGTSVWPST